jgi:nucleoside 2-deoxyribosyltransferase
MLGPMKVYLAGPEVFLPDAQEVAEAKRRLCARHGFEGIFPTDPRPDPAADAEADPWYAIYLRNEAHIRAADLMIANLTPFRGPSADPGTVYEVGFMRALGRPVFGYSNAIADFQARTLAWLGPQACRDGEGAWTDGEGLSLESFGLADNLMIDGGIRAAGGALLRREVPTPMRWRDQSAFEACLEAAARLLRPGRVRSGS